ncbi:deoxynucleotidyltransferase terminal-interacting protein 1 [Agrilus planipennis]|uniref:Deoxynucleotidyltransferase terminal-interacting protein 1 n=1 Tax=Agrilus planipennis TaxID=224129 RepID=A0A1W4XT33_AGRPL|nr:deoxynucleotidyltransferase terminal-interacting protein 1 [Agrilus planipennis]
MIPPLAPGQSSEEQQSDMVGWQNTFNMRQVTLMNIATSHLGSRNGNRLNFLRTGCIKSSAKSLDILRRNLQKAINKDIDNVIKKYLDKFFQPAISNIKMNLGNDSVDDELVKNVCRTMLDEAKAMYSSASVFSRDSSPYDCSDSDAGSLTELKNCSLSPFSFKRKESDTESEASSTHYTKRCKTRVTKFTESPLLKQAIKRDTIKWTADRINENTLFIMGARANKVLGFGQTRGRLYIKHPDLIRYQGDQEDKDWLSSKNLMPPSGGKAYVMLFEDIQELTARDEYRNSPNVQLHELKGFEAPHFMLQKIKAFLNQLQFQKMQNQANYELLELQTNHCLTPLNNPIDSAPSTPSDTLQMLELQTVNGHVTKHVETGSFIQIPDISPESNASFLSVSLSQSPLQSVNVGSNVLVNVINSNDISNSMVVTSTMSNHNSENSQGF